MWPFTRKPKPINPGPINEDWRVGDLAECIVDTKGDWYGCKGPERGDVIKVASIKPALNTIDGRPGWFLSFQPWKHAYQDVAFRKVPPLNSEASAEFTAKIRRCKPAHSPAPVA